MTHSIHKLLPHSDTHLSLKQFLVADLLWSRQVKPGQAERLADSIADVGVKEQRHAADAKVAVSVANSIGRVNLRIGPEIPDSLNVDNDQLMPRTLECEMTECLQQIPYLSIKRQLTFQLQEESHMPHRCKVWCVTSETARMSMQAKYHSTRSMWLHCWCGQATREHHAAVRLISVYLSSTITLTEAFLSTVTHWHPIPFQFHATKENHITWNLASLIFLCNKIKQAQLSQKISHIFCIIAKKKSKVVLFIWKINEHLMFLYYWYNTVSLLAPPVRPSISTQDMTVPK